jgi:hypothetical protein
VSGSTSIMWYRLNNTNSPKLFFRAVLSEGAQHIHLSEHQTRVLKEIGLPSRRASESARGELAVREVLAEPRDGDLPEFEGTQRARYGRRVQ